MKMGIKKATHLVTLEWVYLSYIASVLACCRNASLTLIAYDGDF